MTDNFAFQTNGFSGDQAYRIAGLDNVILTTPHNSTKLLGFSIIPSSSIVPQSNRWPQVSEKLEGLIRLEKGWDGYDGTHVSFECANFAISLLNQIYRDSLPAPQLVPGSDGTLQLEWHCGNFDIELDIIKPYEVDAYRYDHDTGKQDEISIAGDISKLIEWAEELVQRATGSEAIENTNLAKKPSKKIAPADKLIRRINRKHHVVYDERLGYERISTKAMRPSSDGAMSVDVEKLIRAQGDDPKKYVITPDFTGAVEFSTSDAEMLGLQASHTPTNNNPCHGDVRRQDGASKFTRPQQEGLLDASSWLAPIANVQIR